MESYDHKTIEKKWQDKWAAEKAHVVKDREPGKENLYVLVEFPYPSGNLHIGHWYAFGVPDIYARTKKMQGYNVLFPFGFDAFGLPAENAALKHGKNPREWTYQNMEDMKRQLSTMGAMFDWERSVATCDPDYYKWTQWLFLQFLKNKLAYQSETKVNWCPSCKTVLANEQVNAGKCDRCDSDVIQKDLKQWQLKITDFAESLLKGLDEIQWPDEIKEAQRNWIGKSVGAHIKFSVSETDSVVEVFTTRPDTIFGATYMVLAPEHALVHQLKSKITNWAEVEAYIIKTQKKTELERLEDAKEKTGVELQGLTAINPANQKKIPIWIADYVLASYGTGAIMAVPAHDDRDYDFAKKFKLPIIEVVSGGDINQSAYTDSQKGTLVNSGKFNGKNPDEAIHEITAWLEKEGLGRHAITYRMRDWIVSRQRYWGCPIPVIHCSKCGPVGVPESHLPVQLPEIDDYHPRDDGKSPLAKATEWLNVSCPECGGDAERETDTLDTFVDSSWYFLRYTDPKNNDYFAAADKINFWLPVNYYSGGAEHTTMHLLYSRFWIHAMQSIGLVDFKEPYLVRKNRSLILGPDGQKMSKSKGNVVDPDEYVDKLGADTVRLYLAFIGPYNETGTYPWDLQGIQGIRKFLDRVWRLQEKVDTEIRDAEEVVRTTHQTIKKVTEDIEKLKFNTAISQMMILVNLLEKQEHISHQTFKLLVILLCPLTPHIANELWSILGYEGALLNQKWPEYDIKLAKDPEIELVIQVNGKVRDRIIVSADISEEEARTLAMNSQKVQSLLGTVEPKKVIFIKGRLINIVL